MRHSNKKIEDKWAFSTGDIAKICGVAPRTASKWIDSGELKGARLPMSKDRRVQEDDLARFLNKNGMNVSLIDVYKSKKVAENKSN